MDGLRNYVEKDETDLLLVLASMTTASEGRLHECFLLGVILVSKYQ